jgi:hypothetical protein
MKNVRISLSGRVHYTNMRCWRARGTVLHVLPSGDIVVEWPWGLAAMEPWEVDACP